ncbi:hypothetical protein D770_00890 [Flammeovirgaceae bacterium 311]|nr:hypothetical protein D770_00890 [Flammeovirgaceae bacterium 311]
MRSVFLLFPLLLASGKLLAQTGETHQAVPDSSHWKVTVDPVKKNEPPKVLHAEPLYIDLIRDLGARKGEKEWNVGVGLIDNGQFDEYEALVEYEWAPIHRLGLEVEVPFSFYYKPQGSEPGETVPSSKLNSLKLAAQYSFFVSEQLKTSLALGYIHEFEFTEFNNYGKENLVNGQVYNPFFVAAKRWGESYHTLVYSGPVVEHHFGDNSLHTTWQVNTNFHYMIRGSRNFMGVEFNKEISSHDFDMTIRPQMRVGIADNLLVGIVAGIPIHRENQRLSSFLRLIYEPGHKHHEKPNKISKLMGIRK